MAQLTATSHSSSSDSSFSDNERKPQRYTTFFHAAAFVLGFGIVFTLLGSAAGLLGQSLNAYLPAIQRIGAILLVLFGLTTVGAFRWLVGKITAHTDVTQNRLAALLVNLLEFFNALLYTEKRVAEMHTVKRGYGYLSSTLMGMSFSAGWVPCVGPILASILFVAGDSATAVTGAILLAIYSLGLGIPFLITGLAFGRATKALRKLNRHANIVSLVSGAFLFYVAYLLWFDQLTALTGQLGFLNTFVFQIEQVASSALGIGEMASINISVASGAPIALIAGLISFLSPCVLPLIPAYIGYLSGATLNEGT